MGEYARYPNPYMNRKFKDLSRSRCIISYYHPSLKDIYCKAAADLMKCLKAFDFFHTNLFSPLQALPMMKYFSYTYTFIIDSVQKPRLIRGQQMLKKYRTGFLNQSYWKQWIWDLAWLFTSTININFDAAYFSFMFFFRYFDDLRTVVVHWSSDITTKNLAMTLHKLQKQTYHLYVTCT